MILYRPVGLEELNLIQDSGWKRFPPRLAHQPFFYAVLHREYACEIAQKWNWNNGNASYVVLFTINNAFISRYDPHSVGGRKRMEYSIPTEDLFEFNKHIEGLIEIVDVYK